MREWCCSKSDTLVGGVEDRVEALQESVTIDEIKAAAALSTEVSNDEVDLVGSAANVIVEGSGPDLRVRGQLERVLSKTPMRRTTKKAEWKDLLRQP